MVTIKPSKKAMGIQWENIQLRDQKISIWLKNKTARNALLKVLTDAMSVCAEGSPESYEEVHEFLHAELRPGLVVFRKLQSDAVKLERERY